MIASSMISMMLLPIKKGQHPHRGMIAPMGLKVSKIAQRQLLPNKVLSFTQVSRNFEIIPIRFLFSDFLSLSYPRPNDCFGLFSLSSAFFDDGLHRPHCRNCKFVPKEQTDTLEHFSENDEGISKCLRAHVQCAQRCKQNYNESDDVHGVAPIVKAGATPENREKPPVWG
ncbi:hypothetical protein AAW02_17290 (plasmid) [Aeromonas dhakensis]|nr:hypothetical protein AAW03_19375 [Aeromonas dhakensis]PHS84923.1 hypothetical protein AAW02_17290 [Aeromonas dhakensis]